MRTNYFHIGEMTILIFQLLSALNLVHGQFYNIYPPAEIIPNSFSLNSSVLPLGAFLALSLGDGEIPLTTTSADVICIECQINIINNDPNLLPDMMLKVLYYDTSVVNTSQASISALEYSLTSDHIATFGRN